MPAENLRVVMAAPTALAWMHPDRTTRVLYVFERVCDLLDDDGRVISLIVDSEAMGPFAILLADGSGIDFRNFITSDTQAEIRAEKLRLGGAVIDTADVAVWQARPGWERLHGKLNVWLPLLSQTASAGAPPGSLAALLADSMGEADGSIEDQIIARLRPLAADLQAGLRASRKDFCAKAAQAMAGLGNGLTPAGDDFLVGVIYGLWASRPPDQVVPLAEAIIGAAVPRTTRLSAAWLEAAGRGEAGMVWHELIDALAEDNPNRIVACAEMILNVGYTSGADAMAGFISCLTD